MPLGITATLQCLTSNPLNINSETILKSYRTTSYILNRTNYLLVSWEKPLHMPLPRPILDVSQVNLLVVQQHIKGISNL